MSKEGKPQVVKLTKCLGKLLPLGGAFACYRKIIVVCVSILILLLLESSVGVSAGNVV